jgi:D-alanyl-D-alanine carboxypeptidase
MRLNQVERQINEYIQQQTNGAIPFYGSVLVSIEGEVLYKNGIGLGSIEHGVQNTASTKYRIWSITKLFTAVMIMMLYERRILDLEESISHYLANEISFDPRISVRHLLTHTSGIPSYTSDDKFEGTWNKRSLGHGGILKLIQQSPADFEPGADMIYNNSAYYILGLIIEQVTGVSYEHYLKHTILDPLGMLHTGLDHNHLIISAMASGYCMEDNVICRSEWVDIENAYAAGGLYSTVEDLYIWGQALDKNILISATMKERMLTVHAPGYGLGWSVDTIHGKRRVGHAGSYKGYRAKFDMYPDEHASIIVLSNLDVPIELMNDTIAGIIFT